MLGALADAAGFGSGSDAPKTPPVPAKFIKGPPLRTDGESPPDVSAKGGGEKTTSDMGMPTEFIHFGRVHPDHSTHFPHKPIDDTVWPDLQNDKGRASLLRAALQREALLLHGQIGACRAMLAEYEANKGSMGDLANLASTAMSVLGGGGGGGGEKPPKAADLDPLLGRIESAGGPINQAQVKYLDLHKAGVELHQVRAEYRNLLEKRMKPDTDMGMLPPLPSPAGDIARWMFKGYDIYLHMYKTAATKLEPGIDRACYDIGMQAIAARTTPVYQLWSKFEKPPEAAAAEEGDKSWLEEQKEKVEEKVEEAKDWAADKKRAVQEFLGCAPVEQPPGQAYLESVFGAALKSAEWAPEAAQTVIQTVPGIVRDIVGEVSRANAMVLKGAFFYLMDKRGAPIPAGLLIEAGREAIARRLLDALAKLVPFASMLQSKDHVADIGGVGVSGATLGDPLVELLGENVISNIDMIIEAACGGLAQQINSTRKAGGEPVSMEVFLARLPWWLAQMNHNILLPLWDLVADKLFGSITSALGPILGSAGSALDKARSTYKDASKAIDKAGSALSDGVNLGDVASAAPAIADDPMGWAKKQLFGDEQKAAPAPKFPGSARQKHGKGVAISMGEWKKAEHKWDAAGDEEAKK